MRIYQVINAANHGRSVSIKESRVELDTGTEVQPVIRIVSLDSGSARVRLVLHSVISPVLDTRVPAKPSLLIRVPVVSLRKTRLCVTRDAVQGTGDVVPCAIPKMVLVSRRISSSVNTAHPV